MEKLERRIKEEYLYSYEGIDCNSPKSCFRGGFSVGILNEEQSLTCLEMTDDRNLTTHTYVEKVADMIYERIRDYYLIMGTVFNHIKTYL
jgi:nucleotidyltransferase substrate binding protein (TIGR01987 family)